MSEPMKGITCCGDCGIYNWKKHKCSRCKSIETDARKHFFDDCPLPDVVEVVRCKDCRYWQDNNGGYPNPDCPWGKEETPDADDYCSFGERKDCDGE